jgi:hypothetical protein
MPPPELISDPFSQRRRVMLNNFANVAGRHDRAAISGMWNAHRDSLMGARGIFVVGDENYQKKLPGDRDFAGTGFLRCMMGSTRLLNIQNSENAREFYYSAPIFCDTNFVSFCRTFAANGNLGANEAGFREAVKFLLPIRNNLNALPYLFENADRAKATKVRESLLAFAAFKLTAPEEFERTGSFTTSSRAELDRIADESLGVMQGPDFRTVYEGLALEHYRWARVTLLKSTIIAFTTPANVESRMGELFHFLHDELARFPQFPIYLAFRFFSLNQKEPFFSAVQPNAGALDGTLKSMAWDLAHWRTLFDWTMIHSRHSTKAAFPIPHFLSFDRRFIRLVEAFKLDGLIYVGDSKRCEQFLSYELLRGLSDLLHGPLGDFRKSAAVEDRKRRIAQNEPFFDERLVALESELSATLSGLIQKNPAGQGV